MSGKSKLEQVLPDVENQLMVNISDQSDHASFVILFHRFKKPVARYIRTKVNSSSDIENLCQEVFTRLWSNRRNFSPDGKFDVYLFGIAANVVNSFRRKKLKEPKTISIEQAQGRKIRQIQRKLGDYSHPQENLIIQELLKQTDDVVASLPRKYRDVFKLIVEHSYTDRKLSRLLECSETTVRRRYRVAVKKLRKQLSAK